LTNCTNVIGKMSVPLPILGSVWLGLLEVIKNP